LSTGVKRTSGSGFGFFHGVKGQEMSDFCDEAGGGKRFLNVVTFEVDVGIDLVGNTVVALVPFEADVVGGGADPQSLTLDLPACFPDTKVIAGGDDGDGFGASPTIVLGAAEEEELTHRHRQIGFLREAVEDSTQDRSGDVGVYFDPTGGREDTLHGGFGAEDEEIDHVAGVAVFVGDAARNFCEKGIVDAGHGSDLARQDAGDATLWCIDFDANGVGANAGVILHLIDAYGETAVYRSEDVFARADEEGQGDIGIADAAEECASAGSVKWKNAEKIRVASGIAFRTVIILCVGVAKFSRGGDENVLARLNVDTRVRPKLIAGELNFLGEAALARRRLTGGRVGCWRLRLGRRRSGVAHKLGGEERREYSCDRQEGSVQSHSFRKKDTHDGEPSCMRFGRIFTISRCERKRQVLAGKEQARGMRFLDSSQRRR
jgi:hypothetical protein